MEKLSRVKKYEELRKSIEMDTSIDTSTDAKANTEALKSFDSSIFKRAQIKEEGAAKRAKEEEKSEPVQQMDVNDTFTNEYLDDFMKEVREYNIRKGNRESEDTEVDILYQLNAANRAKRTRYVQEIKEEELLERLTEDVRPVLSKDEIAQEVQSLLLEEETAQKESKDVEELVNDAMKTQQIDLSQAVSMVGIKEEEANEEAPVSQAETEQEQTTELKEGDVVPQAEKEALQKKLIEETQQLRVQLDEYEDELSDLSSGVEKNNRILNFVLCFLIFVLLVIIGFIVYSIWKAGGF